jgi:hypothetical protein
MPIEPLGQEEIRTWLTRRELLASMRRLRRCRNGHFSCSTHTDGPCYKELHDRFRAMARDRAAEMVACGADRAMLWSSICRSFPVLAPATVDSIVEEAFDFELPRANH